MEDGCDMVVIFLVFPSMPDVKYDGVRPSCGAGSVRILHARWYAKKKEGGVRYATPMIGKS